MATFEYGPELFKALCSAEHASARGKECKELVGCNITVPAELYQTPARSIAPGNKQWDYLLGETAWYFNGDRTEKGIAPYSKFWSHIANQDGTVNSNYGWLTMYEQLPSGISGADWCVQQLMRDFETRQAIILYNKPEYIRPTQDFICTQSQQFLLRWGKLHSVVYIRSSDAIRGLSFDIPWWSVLQQLIANEIGCKLGSLTVCAGSSHVYSEHYPLAHDLASHQWVHARLRTKLKLHDVVKHKGEWTHDSIAEHMEVEWDG